MCSKRLVMRKDPSTFEVIDLYEYFQKCIKFIGVYIAIDSFFKLTREKQVNGNINSNKFYKFLKIFT
jgi:hypothetical protein